MKFFTKRPDSDVLARNLTYNTAIGADNSLLRNMLLDEQKGFCAYTERFVDETDAVEIDHFNAEKKRTGDNYYNYYVILAKINRSKKNAPFRGQPFFNSLFFQNRKQLDGRIHYTNGVYEEIDPTDNEAEAFIRFIDMNNNGLFNQRRNHINRIRNIFADANYSDAQKEEYFQKYRNELSFITALEHELRLRLEHLL